MTDDELDSVPVVSPGRLESVPVEPPASHAETMTATATATAITIN
jgi:hypothetical protein